MMNVEVKVKSGNFVVEVEKPMKIIDIDTKVFRRQVLIELCDGERIWMAIGDTINISFNIDMIPN